MEFVSAGGYHAESPEEVLERIERTVASLRLASDNRDFIGGAGSFAGFLRTQVEPPTRTLTRSSFQVMGSSELRQAFTTARNAWQLHLEESEKGDSDWERGGDHLARGVAPIFGMRVEERRGGEGQAPLSAEAAAEILGLALGVSLMRREPSLFRDWQRRLGEGE